jgi:putative membrane protein
MKFIPILTAAVIGGCGVAFAQTPAPTPAPMPAPSATTPQAGANSFTEAQARTWIEKAGYTDVGGLVKSEDGVWRGSAKKNGVAVAVAVDFKGNVTTR